MMVLLGIGNPGPTYANSRHNVGIWCIDALAIQHDIRLRDRRRYTVTTQADIAAKTVVLAKSRVYMNDSGIAARYLLDRFKLAPLDLMVVHDDMDLPLGTIRLRPSGGAAGHHGIESIAAELGTEEFARLRIGIGHPQGQGEEITHVLSPFNDNESPVINEALERAEKALTCAIESGLETAMNNFN